MDFVIEKLRSSTLTMKKANTKGANWAGSVWELPLELSQIRIRGNPGRTTALGDPARFYHLAERMGPP